MDKRVLVPDEQAESRVYHLVDVVQRVAQVHDLPALMDILRLAARELTGADGATLVLRDGEQCHYADEDAIGPLWKGQRFPLSSCISGWCMLRGEQVVIEDIYTDPRIPHAAYRPTFVKSLCMVPVGRQQAIGAIGCYWASTHRATPDEIRLQQALADAAAVGIANIELYRQLEAARDVAESRAVEAQRSEALFRATFDHAGTGVALAAPDGRWLQVNQKLCEIVGYPRSQLLDLSFQDITHPDDLPTDLAVVDRMLRGEIRSSTREKRYVHREGHPVWINLTVTLVRSAENEPGFFVAIIEDIQRRKAAEEALEEERTIFRNLADIAAEYFWELDEEFRFKAISPSIAERSGLDYTSYIGLARWNLPFVGVSEVDWARHREVLAARQPFRRFEGGLPNSSGEMRWFEISGDPIFSATGEFRGYRGVTQDITERRRLEDRLRQHAMVFESSEEGIIITDAKGCVIDANAAFERISEYSLDEIRGKNMRFIQSGRHDRSFYLNMWKSIETTGNWQGEIWNRRKGGEIYLEWISISVVKGENGNPLAYVGTSVDIGRMNHAKSEMERLAHHDALTGLPNRLLLGSRLEHALERIKRGGLGALLFLDLDGFKRINDTLGHKAGDELLIAVAARLRARLRDVDTLARLGGDEFVIVLEDVPAPEAVAAVCRELIRELEVPFDLYPGRCGHIGTSIGVALFPRDGTTVAALIERADQALYVAKNDGKGVFRFYSD